MILKLGVDWTDSGGLLAGVPGTVPERKAFT